MWDDRLNDYLDGNEDIDRANEDLRRQYTVYRYIMRIYAAKLSYSPSSRKKAEFLKKIRRRNIMKKGFGYALVAGSAAVILFLTFGIGSESNTPSNVFNDVVNSVQIVRTIGDGF